MNPNCPVCESILDERHAGLYCVNKKCPVYTQKVVACCEGAYCV